ncbi:MAG: radical SAM family heme chaperone HemW [bacterium]
MLANIKHLYIHVPFCKNKCPYCDFFSVPNSEKKDIDLYIGAIIKEIQSFSHSLSKPLDTVYFGGGSPLMAGNANISKILDKISGFISKETELSIEVNPEHLEGSFEFLTLGFNRISIGVQTTNSAILKKIKRKYNPKVLVDNIKKIRARNILLSIDIMFGLPGQKLKDLEEDLDFIIDQKPDHISCYLFTPPYGYELKDECASDSLTEKMFSMIHTVLCKHGYEHYEVSNYCLKNKVCKHNMAYWERKSYVGVGAAAHSFISQEKQRRWHKKNIESYINNPLSFEEKEIITPQMAITEEIMLGLRLINKGIKIDLVKNKDYQALINRGLLKINKDHLLVTESGITLLDYIITSLV